jgi:16S rRNA (cytidine1402-2'-O)-methyltransferase
VATLRTLAELDAERPAAVCRELTKLHEEVRRASARELAEHFEANAPRGEIVLVVGGAPAGAGSREQALVGLRELIDAGARARPAAAVIARLTGVGANELYRALTSQASEGQ